MLEAGWWEMSSMKMDLHEKMQGCVRESVLTIDFMCQKNGTQTYAPEDVTRTRKFMYSSAILYASAINIRSENNCTDQRGGIIITYDFPLKLYSCLSSVICSIIKPNPAI